MMSSTVIVSAFNSVDEFADRTRREVEFGSRLVDDIRDDFEGSFRGVFAVSDFVSSEYFVEHFAFVASHGR